MLSPPDRPNYTRCVGFLLISRSVRIRRWNQLISNVLPVRDKSDEEELEPAGWKTSELRELVGVGCSFVPAFERRGGGLF